MSDGCRRCVLEDRPSDENATDPGTVSWKVQPQCGRLSVTWQLLRSPLSGAAVKSASRGETDARPWLATARCSFQQQPESPFLEVGQRRGRPTGSSTSERRFQWRHGADEALGTECRCRTEHTWEGRTLANALRWHIVLFLLKIR